MPGVQPTRLRVLLAADDSDAAGFSEDWLLRLRWSTPPLVDVLCVATRRWHGLGLPAQTYRTAVRDALGDLRQGELMTAMRIANEAGQRLQGGGLPVQVWARHGAPPDEIVAVVRSERPDLVVVGPRGRRSRLLPRPSVLDQVIRRTEVAVLVTRPSGNGALPNRILLPVMDAHDAELALRWLSTSGWLGDGEITLVGMPVSGNPTGVSLARLATLAAADVRSGGVAQRALPIGPSVDRLLAMISETATDLVVMTHPRPGQRDVLTEEIASASPTSVLVLPVYPGSR